jgi:hypothetical protein
MGEEVLGLWQAVSVVVVVVVVVVVHWHIVQTMGMVVGMVVALVECCC